MLAERRRRGMRALVVALVAALIVPLLALGLTTAPAAADTTVTFTGHGFGHGRGMGQYGAFGYATKPGLQWSYQQIVDHFYGGTTLANIGAANISVRLLGQDSQELIVYQPSGAYTVNGVNAVNVAVRIARVGPNAFALFDGPSCGGPWTARPGGSWTGTIRVSNTSGSTAAASLSQLCQVGQTVSYYGDLVAVDASGAQATVNVVSVEQYLYGVVPRESPASWGDAAGGKGMEALRAQAIAARSYGLSEQRWSFAQTCDTTSCQVYGGAAITPSGGPMTVITDPRSNYAVDTTAGLVRLMNSNSAIARTEFSSSTGGFTAGGTFPAVVDDGDDVSSNPYHTWTRSMSFSDLSAKLGVGTVTGVEVTQRDGNGPDGGRALQVAVATTGGTVTLGGTTVQARVGLLSTYFFISGVPPSTFLPFSSAQAMVAQQYVDLLGRPADPGGLDSWTAKLNAGQLTPGQMVAGFMTSPEFGGIVAPICRLYLAALQRTADYSGFAYWLGAQRNGATRADMASYFASSPEFVSRYGSLDDNGFVTLLYQNVLGRSPDSDGRNYWVSALQHGASRGTVLLGFSESAEYVVNTAAQVNATLGYLGLLRRSPDANGLAYWTGQLQQGFPLASYAAAILGTAEYAARF